LREKLRHCSSEAERHRMLIATRSTSAQEYDAVATLRNQSELELKEQEAELEHLRQYITPEHQAMLAATIRHAQAQLGLTEQRLRETKLVAPFDGQVLKMLKREGEGVSAFEPEAVVLFGDRSRLRVRAEIDERFVRRIAVGQRAVVHGRNLEGMSFGGRVASLEPIMGDKTVFTRGSSERKDLDVLQVIIDFGADFQAPIGLQVDVVIEAP
jgi:HlyD family secretion protein